MEKTFPSAPASGERTGALYIRVSTHSQDELSPDAQKRLLLEYAAAHRIQIQPELVFVESVSGRNAQKRPEFQRMIALAKAPAHPFSVILVWKFSRFARNQEESIVYKRMLKKDGVEVISISEPVMDGPFGSLIERIIEWMDEYYSIRLSGEVLRGMSEKARRHGYQITPPLGYAASGEGRPFWINEEEYSIVSYIMDQYDRLGRSPASIARSLTEQGYRTRRGRPFEGRTVSYILKNPFYCGIVQWNGQQFQGTHPVRLTQEAFFARQKRMAAQKTPLSRRPSLPSHWLSGMIRCWICGSSLALTGNRDSPSLQCWRYARGIHQQSCAITLRRAEALILSFFRDLSHKYPRKYRPLSPPPASPSQREALLRQLEQLTQRERRIREAYEKGVDTLEEFGQNKQRLLCQRKLLQNRLSQLEEAPSPHPSPPPAADPASLLEDDSISPETKSSFLHAFCGQMVYEKPRGILYVDLFISDCNEAHRTGS